MNKKIRISMVMLALSMMLAQPLSAAKKPNARKGKYLFRKYCRSCHMENGSATALSPISKTQAQWTAVFKNGEFKNLKCSDVWAKRSKKDLNDIYAYMHAHAYDSPSPLKCK